jgi:hypothetical protein
MENFLNQILKKIFNKKEKTEVEKKKIFFLYAVKNLKSGNEKILSVENDVSKNFLGNTKKERLEKIIKKAETYIKRIEECSLNEEELTSLKIEIDRDFFSLVDSENDDYREMYMSTFENDSNPYCENFKP